MKVSIIIPVYKVEPYIEDCLKSVYNQTYGNIEVILVNDCTPDRSMQIARDYVNMRGLSEGIEVKFLEHDINRGLSAARNTGIFAATGDYIFFLDSDDEITPNCISLLVEPLSRINYDFVIGEFKIIGSDKEYPSLELQEGEIVGNEKIFHEYCSKQFYMMACGKLCNAEFLRKNKLYFKEGIIHEDDLWSLQVALVAESMYVVRKPSYIYKIRQGSITENEFYRDKINNLVLIIKMMNESIVAASTHSSKDIMSLFDNYFKRRYISTITHGWRQEYDKLRSVDCRPFFYILKKCMGSKQYLRTHGHRLLPASIAFNVYSMISKKL